MSSAAGAKAWREANSDRVRAYSKARKVAASEYNKAWKAANPDKVRKHRERDKRHREHRDWTDGIKLAAGCAHCGDMENPAMLNFHHVDPSTKLFILSDAFSRPREIVEAEIAKCIVLCNRCHAREHQRLKVSF